MALTWLATPSTTCPPPATTAMSASAPPVDHEVVPVQTDAPVVATENSQASGPPPVEDATMPVAAAMPSAADNNSSPPAAADNGSPPARTEKRAAATRTAAYRRALVGRTPEVQACARVAAGGLDTLTVAVHIESSGRVSTQLVGEPEGPLSRCVDAALRQTPLAAPSAPVTFKHTFALRPTPHRP